MTLCPHQHFAKGSVHTMDILEPISGDTWMTGPSREADHLHYVQDSGLGTNCKVQYDGAVHPTLYSNVCAPVTLLQPFLSSYHPLYPQVLTSGILPLSPLWNLSPS